MGLQKIFGSVSEKARGVADKATQAYRDAVGEDLREQQAEMAAKMEALKVLEESLNARQKILAQRESELKKFYLVPRWAVKAPIIIAIILGIGFGLNKIDLPPTQEEDQAVAETKNDPAGSHTSQQTITGSSNSRCVQKGIAYYKDLGSYPFLSTGENAEAKVRGMCATSPVAFGSG